MKTPSQKLIADRLYVHMDRVDGPHLVGELELDDTAAGGFAARFRYLPQWLEGPLGFPIDPLNLPLSDQWVTTTSKFISLGVLFDAGPDMWGRRVFREGHSSQNGDPSERDILLMGRGNGVGALLFATGPTLSRGDLPGLETLPTIEDDLERVHQAAHGVFSTAPLDEQQQHLLAGSWSMGGARAKAVMRDKQGRIWVVKFSEPNDQFDRQRGEMANLLMAKAIGMRTPEVHIRDTALGSALLIERFDRGPDLLNRLHYASAISLVSAEPQDKRMTSARDRAIFSYARLADIISRVSPDPTKDRQELFARMVLNVCVHNTDDHMKNTGFIEAPGGALGQMELAPVFDVVTQRQAQHFLTIGTQGRVGSLDNALSEPRKFGLTTAGAKQIADLVVSVVSARHEFYAQVGLEERDIQVLDACIGDRCPIEAHPRDRHNG